MNNTILMVAPYFPPQGGGLERYVYEISLRLRARGMRVVVVASKDPGSDTVETIAGVKVYRLARTIKISNTPLAFNWFSKLRRIIREENPDLINVHTPVPGIGNIAALCAGQRPLIVTYHGGSMRKPEGSLGANAAVWLYEAVFLPLLLRRADNIICVSEFVREFLKKYDKKISVITPGIDTELFRPDPAKKSKLPTVLFVGGLNASEQFKGLWTLLDALSEVQKTIPLQLVVVGDGDMREQYEAKAHELNIVAQFVGKISNEQLPGWYQGASVFALPTENESFGMVILEALGCGVPVVASAVGGVSSLIEDNVHGFLVEPRDSKAVAQKILILLADRALAERMGVAARAKAEQFNWAARADRYEALLQKVLLSARLIVQVSAYYPPHLGGIERMVETVARLWSAQGGRSLVITSNNIFKTSITNEAGVQVRRLASFEFAHTPWAPTLLLHLLALPRRSLVHLHLSQAYWADLVWLLMPLRRIPYMVHFHLDVEPSGYFGRLFVFYKKLMWGPILRGAQRVAVCSPAQVALVERYCVARTSIEVIPNGVPEAFFATQRRAQNGTFTLVYIGRIAAQKRVGLLVDMMMQVKTNTRLIIAGSGDERPQIERSIAQKKLQTISLRGALPHEGVQALLREADLFVIASEKEGMPLSVLEAMASGVPVVGADVIGIRELIGECGVRVAEPFAPNAAQIVDSLFADPARRQALSERSSVAARAYTWDASMQKLRQVYVAL